MTVKIYVADQGIRQGQLDALHRAIPPGWQLVQDPQEASAILTENEHIPQSILTAAGDGLRLIARLDPGGAEVAATSVPVVDLANTALIGVAEHAVTFILALSRHLPRVSRLTAAQEWVPDISAPALTDQRNFAYNWIGLDDFGTLYRKTVGIVGLGYVGRAVAERLRPFGVRLIYTQRHRLPAEDEDRYSVGWRDLDGLLRESDFVTLHHRFHDGAGGNDCQFGAREFGLMRSTAYLINTSRGRMVDEEALAQALEQGQIAGAGLDVFRYEPLPPESPLLRLAGDNLLLTPHTAGAPMDEAWRVAAEEFVERLQTAL